MVIWDRMGEKRPTIIERIQTSHTAGYAFDRVVSVD